ncbi:MAG: cytochrome c oxidase subunit 3 [Coriobacteriales bacterium]|nr:cytochrome c oxidase subunit 3 [Coriobacteriales bacterium]
MADYDILAMATRADEAKLAKQRARVKPPGVEGMWIVIVGDLLMFLVYFLVFSIARAGDPVTFELGRQQLNPLLSFANTLVLLTSSWFVFRAVVAARGGDKDAIRRNLIVAIVLGFTFVVLKLLSYAIDLSHFTLDSNIFFSYYFAVTGIHCVHVFVGTILLIVAIAKTRKVLNETTLAWTECIGLFWHMVDLLWVIIFPLFYLMGSGVV